MKCKHAYADFRKLWPARVLLRQSFFKELCGCILSYAWYLQQEMFQIYLPRMLALTPTHLHRREKNLEPHEPTWAREEWPKYLIRDFPFLFFWAIFLISFFSFFFLLTKMNLHVSSLSSTHLNLTHKWCETIYIINGHVSAQTLNFELKMWKVGELPATKAPSVFHEWYLNSHSIEFETWIWPLGLVTS